MSKATGLRTRGVLLGLLLALSGPVAFAAPASAAEPIPAECKVGMFCVWEDAKYGQHGGFRNITGSVNLDLYHFDNGVQLGGHISSYVNRRSGRVCLQEKSNGTGGRICDNAGGRREDLSLDHWENVAGSPDNNTRHSTV